MIILEMVESLKWFKPKTPKQTPKPNTTIKTSGLKNNKLITKKGRATANAMIIAIWLESLIFLFKFSELPMFTPIFTIFENEKLIKNTIKILHNNYNL